MTRMHLRRLGLLTASAALALSAFGQQPSLSAQAANAVPLVAVDPGHGGDDYGSSAVANGRRLVEKEIALTVARQTAALLQQSGYRTLLLRTDDGGTNKGQDRTGDGKVDLADDLQARVDKANEAGATVLVSIQFNGSTDRSLRGTEIYYSPARPFAAESRKLADATMAAVARRLKEAGRAVTPRGVLPDSALGGPLYLLGPAAGRIARASAMPGVLIEGLFLTNASDAALLADPATLQTLARGYADGIATYLGPVKQQPKRAQIVGAEGAYLRPSPLVGAEPLTLLDPGTTVDLAEPARGDEVGGSSDWWRVNVKGKAGYVFAALLEPVTGASPPTTPAAPPRATVRNDDGRAARLRRAPTREAEIVARAQPGETVEIVDAANGEAVDGKTARWLKVTRANGDNGWVWAPLVDQ